MIAQATITSKGQITIPKSIRDLLGTSVGSKVMFLVVDGKVEMRPVAPISSLFGAVKAPKYVDVHEAREEAHRNRVKERAERNARN